MKNAAFANLVIQTLAAVGIDREAPPHVRRAADDLLRSPRAHGAIQRAARSLIAEIQVVGSVENIEKLTTG